MESTMISCNRPLFRVIVPKLPPETIFSMGAKTATSLSAVMIATVANKALSWLDVEVVDENNYRRSLRAPLDANGNPDHAALQRERPATFIGLSCTMTNAMPRVLDLVCFYRQDSRVKGIFAGGRHVHNEPVEILEAGADVVVHGEGEGIIVELLTAFASGLEISRIPGISYKQEGSVVRNEPKYLKNLDLDTLPHPDFSLVGYSKIKTFPVSRTRGCSGNCEFCSVNDSPRWISPERFLDQFRYLISIGVRKFFIVDDRVEEDMEGARRFFSLLAEDVRKKKLRLDIMVQARLSCADDDEFLKLMNMAGVTNVCIGYESPIVDELKAMQKPINPKKMLEWTRKFKRAGFFIHAMMIFGYPLKTQRSEEKQISARELADLFWKFLKQAIRAGVDTLKILLPSPITGTPLWSRLKKEGRLYDVDRKYHDGTRLLFQPDPGIDPKELQLEYIRLMRKFYVRSILWPMKSVSLVVHIVRIGFITISLPVEYFISGFGPWYNKWRNSLIYFGAHLIIWKWHNNFKKSKFIAKLRRTK